VAAKDGQRSASGDIQFRPDGNIPSLLLLDSDGHVGMTWRLPSFQFIE